MPDFFANTVWNGGLVPAWNATANFFSQTVPNFFVNTVWNDFMVGTIYQKGLLPAWNWTANTAVKFGRWMSQNWKSVVDWAIMGIDVIFAVAGIVSLVVSLPAWVGVAAAVAAVVSVG